MLAVELGMKYAPSVGRLEGYLRLALGFIFLGIVMPAWMLALIPFLPWRLTRIHMTNHLGTVAGSGVMWLSGCPLEIVGHDKVSADRPVIYAGNHTSIYDAFTSIWLSPLGTVGVAKREIIYYPIYGLAWYLSGHLRIDRANTARGKASIRRLSAYVQNNGLHVYMFPEGTRSTDGRLLPLKKGIVHLAMQTGLPIMPVVTSGAHLAWDKGTLQLRRTPIRVEFLDPISTDGWSEASSDEHIQEIWEAMRAALPPDQQPAERHAGASARA